MTRKLLSGCQQAWHSFDAALRRFRKRVCAGLGRLTPGRRSRGTRELKAAFEALDGELKKVGGATAAVEQKFLNVTSALEKLPDSSRDLVQRSERLLSLVSCQDGSDDVFKSSIALLEDSLCHVDRSQAETTRLIQLLQQGLVQIDRMLSSEAELQRTVAPLKFIQTLFKVESARLSFSVQQLFLALTEDIQRLQHQVHETFSTRFEVLRGARQTLVDLIPRLELAARDQHWLALEKKKTIQQAVSTLDKELKRNRERDTHLTLLSKTVSEEVSKLVVSLQAQDIISQRVAHVVEASGIMSGRFAEAVGTSGNGRFVEALACSAEVAEVQAAQLQASGADLLRAGREMSAVVAGLKGAFHQINSECFKPGERNAGEAEADNLVPILLEAFTEVRTVVEASAKLAEQSHASIRPIGGLTSNVTQTMRELTVQIRLIALNAQLQAAHVGSGTGLEVLAAGTGSIALATTEISESVGRQLDELTAGLKTLVGSFEDLSRSGLEQLSGLQSKQREDRLHAFREETLPEHRQLEECVRGMAVLIDSMGQEIDCDSIVRENLNGGIEALTAVACIARKEMAVTGRITGAATAALQLADRYTMASEREVHQAVVNGRGGQEHETPEPPAADMEWFTDLPPVDPAASSRPGLPEQSDLPELLQTKAASSSHERRAGDNVELF